MNFQRLKLAEVKFEKKVELEFENENVFIYIESVRRMIENYNDYGNDENGLDLP